MELKRTAKTLTAAGLIAALALIGTACGNDADTVDTTQPEATSASESADAIPTADELEDGDESGYTAALANFDVNTGTDELGVNLGWATCDAWDAGASFTTTMLEISPLDGSGFTARESGYIMGAAAWFLCPDHLAAANEWSESQQ
jgi:hypothetical protein